MAGLQILVQSFFIVTALAASAAIADTPDVDANEFAYSSKTEINSIVSTFVREIDQGERREDGQIEYACGYLPLKLEYDKNLAPYVDYTAGPETDSIHAQESRRWFSSKPKPEESMEGVCVVPVISDEGRNFLSPQLSAVDWGLYFSAYLKAAVQEQKLVAELNELNKTNQAYLDYFSSQKSFADRVPQIRQQVNTVISQYQNSKIDRLLTEKLSEILAVKKAMIESIKWAGSDIYQRRGLEYPVVWHHGRNGAGTRFIVFLPIPRLSNNKTDIALIKAQFLKPTLWTKITDSLEGAHQLTGYMGRSVRNMSSSVNSMVKSMESMNRNVAEISDHIRSLPQMTTDVSQMVDRMGRMNQIINGLGQNVGKMQQGMNPMGMMMNMFGFGS